MVYGTSSLPPLENLSIIMSEMYLITSVILLTGDLRDFDVPVSDESRLLRRDEHRQSVADLRTSFHVHWNKQRDNMEHTLVGVSYQPSDELLCLWNVKIIETVHEGQYPNLHDNWTDIYHRLVLLKSSMLRNSHLLSVWTDLAISERSW